MSALDCTTEGRHVNGYPGYRVTPDGAVWSSRTSGQVHVVSPWHRLKADRDVRGYCVLQLRRADGKWLQRKVHQLVLEAFVGPRPPGMLTRHLNGNPADNRLANLAWGTQRQNVEDRRRHGRGNLGERNPQARLTEDVVRAIRREYAAGTISQSALAKRHGIAQPTVCEIIGGKRWGHLL